MSARKINALQRPVRSLHRQLLRGRPALAQRYERPLALLFVSVVLSIASLRTFACAIDCSDEFKSSAYLATRAYSIGDSNEAYTRNFGDGIVTSPIKLDAQYRRFCSYAAVDYPTTGFQAAVYRDCKTGTTYISYRGTELTEAADLRTDLAIGRTEIAGQKDREWRFVLRQAQEFTDSVIGHVRSATTDGPLVVPQGGKPVSCPAECNKPTGKIILTGHSLGGAIAQVEGARTGLEAHTFNAPGMSRSVEFWVDNPRTSGIRNHVRFGGGGTSRDYVSVAGRHVGCVVEYPNSGYDLTIIDSSGARRADTVDGIFAHRMADFMFDALECNFGQCQDVMARNSERGADVREQVEFFSRPQAIVYYGPPCLAAWKQVQLCYGIAEDVAKRIRTSIPGNEDFSGVPANCETVSMAERKCQELRDDAVATCQTTGASGMKQPSLELPPR